jgi:hypothetical protein
MIATATTTWMFNLLIGVSVGHVSHAKWGAVAVLIGG